MHEPKAKRRARLKPILFTLLASSLAGPMAAPGSAAEIVIGKIEKIEIKGDFRLRQENFRKRQDVDRSRQRFRLRLGTELPFSDRLKAKLRLASGTGEQVSTNQSFDNLSAQKGVWIDQAALEYKPWDPLKLTGGRMGNPLWTVYSSDIVWDGDFNPEGAGQNLTFSLFGRGRFFLNGLQSAVDEDSATNVDQWLVSGQAGFIVPVFSASRFTLAGAVHEWVHETTTTNKSPSFNGSAGSRATLGQLATNEGNRRYASGVLENEFRVMELTGEFLTGILGRPLSLQGTYIKNTAYLDSRLLQTAPNEKADQGHQFGLIYGKAAGKGSWEAAYFRKYSETDATVADVADSDFGDGGTNREGHIGWIGYGLNEGVTVSLKAFNTKVVNTKLGGPDDINRYQLDLQVKF
ncbi:MAG: putative porin [Elusimicrobiota bacterium]